MLIAIVFLLASASYVMPQETGSVSGIVFDQAGVPAADVEVRLTGAAIPAGRMIHTDQNGMYSLKILPPGSYSVGAGSVMRAVYVSAGADTHVDLVLGSNVTEELTVTAYPAVNLTSTKVGFNYPAGIIEALPLSRTYAGLLQIIPGIADNGAFAPNGGAGRQDNTFLVDGVNITNPLFGYLSTEINAFDILEFRANTAGISADIGRTLGFMTDAVTRSGTNRLSGGFQFETIPSEWVAESDKRIRSTEDRQAPAFRLGGPILRDRAFFYTSGLFLRSKTTDRSNNLGRVPDRKESTNEIFGKLSLQPSSRMSLNIGYRVRPTTVRYASIGSNDSPDVATDSETTNRIVNAAFDWFPSERTDVSAKYLHMDEEFVSVAVKDLGFKPAFNPNNLAAMGSFTQGGITIGANSQRRSGQDYERKEFRITASRHLPLTGWSHRLSAGFGVDSSKEILTRTSNGWGSISLVTVAGEQQISTVYFPDQDAQAGISRTYSIFGQDNVTIGRRTTLNLGVLVNHDEFAQKTDMKRTFVTFGFGSEVQPRLGINYNVRSNVGDKIFASWGRYYALEQKSSVRALAPRRLYTSEAFWTPAGQPISDTPQANTVSKVIDAGLKPPFQDEAIVGYSTPLGQNWKAGVFYVYRNASDFIEDAPTVLPFSNFVYRNDADADRKYHALTLDVGKRSSNGWAMNANYVWSRMSGSYDQDYSGGLQGTAVFNTSSLIDDGPGSFTTDEFRAGVLSQDRSHVFKVFASDSPPRISLLTLGAYLRSQSGAPYEKRGLPRASSTTYLLLFEPLGTYRNDAWTNVDLLAAYRFPIPHEAAIKLEGRVMNLFNDERPLLRDTRWITSRTIPPDSAYASCNGNRTCATAVYRSAQNTSVTNAAFGQPTNYAVPRRFLLTLTVEF